MEKVMSDDVEKIPCIFTLVSLSSLEIEKVLGWKLMKNGKYYLSCSGTIIEARHYTNDYFELYEYKGL